MLGAELAHGLEVAGLGEHDADIHHHRLEDHRPDLVSMLGEHLLEGRDVVERDDLRVLGGVGRDPPRERHRPGSVPAFGRVERRNDREHHRVVVAVIRALDLEERVLAGRSSSESHRVHRRFGPRVREADLVEVEPSFQLLGELDCGLGRGRELGAGLSGLYDRLGDLRVGVPHRHRAEPVMEIDVLVAVDVRYMASVALGEIDRVRVARLERGRHAERHRVLGPVVEGLGGLGASLEVGDLLLADVLRACVDGLVRCRHGSSSAPGMTSVEN